MKVIKVTGSDCGQRMDKFLLKYFKGATSGFLHKMLRKKNITLNKAKATGSELLQNADEIQVFFSDETFEKMRGLKAQDAEYDRLCSYYDRYRPAVIYECDDFLACNKPAGIRSQKMAPEDISINEYLLSYLIYTRQLDFDSFSRFRPSVVNRLDTNTTGIILFAKTLHGAKKLTEAIREHRIEKYYLAVAAGSITDPILLDGYLKKDHESNRVEVVKKIPDGETEDYDRILTEIRPVCLDQGNTLILVKLVTGKSHQIRAHLKSVGHPIIGDYKYGDPAINKRYQSLGVKNQLLHAYRVITDSEVITCPPPDIFWRVINYGDLEFQRTQGLGF